jgi:Skp family chaperone for outer membrane proteins
MKMSSSRDFLIPRSTGSRLPIRRIVSVLASLTVAACVYSMVFMQQPQQENQAVVLLESTDHSDHEQQLKRIIANLTSELSKANKTITKLRLDLLKCKRGSAALKDSDSKESDDEDSEKAEQDSEDQERYRQYLLNFKINDQAKRSFWPWSDDTLYYEKLGGENGIQYSDADAAVDSGRAEQYGRDRAFSAKHLEDSLNDHSYYGES